MSTDQHVSLSFTRMTKIHASVHRIEILHGWRNNSKENIYDKTLIIKVEYWLIQRFIFDMMTRQMKKQMIKQASLLGLL